MTVRASFTDEIKAELANVQPARPCCQEAELTALAEALVGTSDSAAVMLRIPRNAVARKVVHLAKVAGGRVETVRKGATRAVMRFENDRILRDMRSQANRRANGETANLDKRLRAALQQREAVRRLKARDARLQTLAPALREIAELRWAHPRAGLKELAELAQVSKSAAANRLRRLVVQANRNDLIA